MTILTLQKQAVLNNQSGHTHTILPTRQQGHSARDSVESCTHNLARSIEDTASHAR